MDCLWNLNFLIILLDMAYLAFYRHSTPLYGSHSFVQLKKNWSKLYWEKQCSNDN